MSKTINKEGGSAFPIVVGNNVSERGMSLRDWFAGMALQGIFANHPVATSQRHVPGFPAAASWAYAAADAMLAARKEQP